MTGPPPDPPSFPHPPLFRPPEALPAPDRGKSGGGDPPPLLAAAAAQVGQRGDRERHLIDRTGGHSWARRSSPATLRVVAALCEAGPDVPAGTSRPKPGHQAQRLLRPRRAPCTRT